jgi:hypothetical protein
VFISYNKSILSRKLEYIQKGFTLNLQKGIYQHYKGNRYEVLNTARHSETEEWMVVYKALYGEESIWIRPYNMFTGDVNVKGKEVKRFTFVDED